jgi:hypothetical protein
LKQTTEGRKNRKVRSEAASTNNSWQHQHTDWAVEGWDLSVYINNTNARSDANGAMAQCKTNRGLCWLMALRLPVLMADGICGKLLLQPPAVRARFTPAPSSLRYMFCMKTEMTDREKQTQAECQPPKQQFVLQPIHASHDTATGISQVPMAASSTAAGVQNREYAAALWS